MSDMVPSLLKLISPLLAVCLLAAPCAATTGQTGDTQEITRSDADAKPQTAPSRKKTKKHRKGKKQIESKKGTDGSGKEHVLVMTAEELQIMAERNKLEKRRPKTRQKQAKPKPESAYDKAVKSIDEYISSGSTKQ